MALSKKTNSDSKRNRFALKSVKSNNINGYIFMLPMLIILYLFIWRPTVLGSVWSFFKMNGFTVSNFCGFDNFENVITNSKFVPMLFNTFKYVFWSLIIDFLPPLFIAIMINEIVHFKNAFRVLIYLPMVIPGIAAMLIWYFMYYPDETGLFNMLFAKFGIGPFQWISDPKFSIIGIVIFTSWKSFPATMLLYYAALQGTSVELYEAALIDGSSPFKRFLNVTVPSIEGLILLNLVRQIISVFQIMEAPLAMTGGGPNGSSTSLAYQMYMYGFNSGGKGVGQAMALGLIIFVILMILTVFYFFLNKKVEDRY